MNSLNRLAPPQVSAFSSLFPHLDSGTPRPLPPVTMQWIAVRQRFQQFHDNLLLTSRQSLDGMTKRNGVVGCLNRHYYGSTSDTDNSFLGHGENKPPCARPATWICISLCRSPFTRDSRATSGTGNPPFFRK